MDEIIEELKIYPLKRFDDDRGAVLKYVSKISPFYNNISEVYFSKVNRGIVKGWKKHKRVKQHLVVPHGEVKLVVYDDRKKSSTYNTIQTIFIGGMDHYNLVIIPNQVFYAFQGIGIETTSLICNYIEEVHDPNESETLEINSKVIPYNNWKL